MLQTVIISKSELVSFLLSSVHGHINVDCVQFALYVCGVVYLPHYVFHCVVCVSITYSEFSTSAAIILICVRCATVEVVLHCAYLFTAVPDDVKFDAWLFCYIILFKR